MTVFERNDRIGGLLRYGIPNMKLDKRVIDRRICLMEERGRCISNLHRCGKKYFAGNIEKKFDRIVLACGASTRETSRLRDESTGIFILRWIFCPLSRKAFWIPGFMGNQISAEGKHVLVIGGGDTGNDCVGTAVRLGAKSVTQLEMMPEPPENGLRQIHGRSGRE